MKAPVWFTDFNGELLDIKCEFCPNHCETYVQGKNTRKVYVCRGQCFEAGLTLVRGLKNENTTKV
jgi:hypothetical protein